MNVWVDPQRELRRLERQLDRLAEVLNRVEPGWFIDTEWVDASTSRNVPLQRLPIDNRHVETRKFTRGKFVTVQEGKTWHDPHLVMSMERTDDLSEITVVPLIYIRTVEVAESKTPLETVKAAARPSPMRAVGAPRREKRLLRFTDGSTKEIGLTRKRSPSGGVGR